MFFTRLSLPVWVEHYTLYPRLFTVKAENGAGRLDEAHSSSAATRTVSLLYGEVAKEETVLLGSET